MKPEQRAKKLGPGQRKLTAARILAHNAAIEQHVKLLPSVAKRILSAAATLRSLREIVLRAHARWLERKGYWPTPKQIADARDYNYAACKLHVSDLIGLGMLRQHSAGSHELTDAGWAYLNMKPLKPTLPASTKVRKTAKKYEAIVKKVEAMRESF